MKIHWFSITVHSSYDYCLDLWDKFFSLELGELQNTTRGGRGFQNIDVGFFESKLYYNPIQQTDGTVKDYCHFEFTGSACDCVIPTHFSEFVSQLQGQEIKFKVTRIDIAWDDLSFTPLEFYKRVYDGEAISCVKLHKEGSNNENFSVYQSPFELRDNGQVGTSTCYFGSKTSQRFLRVYDKRGGTRLEFVCRDDRAHFVTLDIFQHNYSDWDIVARENLLDFVRFDYWLQWLEFVAFAQKADLVISSARRVSLSKIERWMDRQLAVALSVFYDVHGWKEAQSKLDRMLLEARESRNRDRYKYVLALRPPFENIGRSVVPWTHFVSEFDLQ
jgi:hypothetical protein